MMKRIDQIVMFVWVALFAVFLAEMFLATVQKRDLNIVLLAWLVPIQILVIGYAGNRWIEHKIATLEEGGGDDS